MTENSDHEDLDEIEQRVRRRIRSEGIEAAVEAAIAVLRDPKAAAPAKATMTTAMLRAGGLFKEREDDGEGELPSLPELRAFIRRGERQMADFERNRAERAAAEMGSAGDDVFG